MRPSILATLVTIVTLLPLRASAQDLVIVVGGGSDYRPEIGDEMR